MDNKLSWIWSSLKVYKLKFIKDLKNSISLLYIYLSNISNGQGMNTAWYIFTLDYHDEIYASQVSIPLSSPPDLANVCMMHLENFEASKQIKPNKQYAKCLIY